MTAVEDRSDRVAFRRGYMGPQAVIQLLAAIETFCGEEARVGIMREARLKRAPGWDEPVREDRVARLHQALRRGYPDKAEAIGREAGRATTDYLLDNRISKRAQALMKAAPKTVAAWLLRQAQQQPQGVRAFAGSGKLEFLSATLFELRDNPVLAGETAAAPVCHYHAAAFERMYQKMVDVRIICREIACKAAGAPACRFELSYAPAG